ncbi:hypothetical protein Bbelb_437660 [Branchiostoma belcheri]|nr:hypothetical protein Bbelb_437660 [Branchiostoma belcheri]
MATGCQLLQQDGDDIGRNFWEQLNMAATAGAPSLLARGYAFKDGTSVGFRKPINIALLRVRVEKFKFSGPAGDLSVRLTYRGTADQLTMMNAGQNNSYSANTMEDLERHGQPHHTDDNGTTHIMQISGDVSGSGDGL